MNKINKFTDIRFPPLKQGRVVQPALSSAGGTATQAQVDAFYSNAINSGTVPVLTDAGEYLPRVLLSFSSPFSPTYPQFKNYYLGSKVLIGFIEGNQRQPVIIGYLPDKMFVNTSNSSSLAAFNYIFPTLSILYDGDQNFNLSYFANNGAFNISIQNSPAIINTQQLSLFSTNLIINNASTAVTNNSHSIKTKNFSLNSSGPLALSGDSFSLTSTKDSNFSGVNLGLSASQSLNLKATNSIAINAPSINLTSTPSFSATLAEQLIEVLTNFITQTASISVLTPVLGVPTPSSPPINILAITSIITGCL